MRQSRTGLSFSTLAVSFLLLFTISYEGSAGAQPPPATTQGDLEISGAWARATPPGARTGAAYLSLVNRGSAPDRLVAANSPAAEKTELHAHINEGGVMRMKAVDTISVAPGERLSLRPGGLHVMLIDLKAPLREGSRLSLTLRFAGAGDVTVEVPVLRNAPSGPAAGHTGH